MRAVIDSNVHVSALIGTGPPTRIMAEWQGEQAFELVICPNLVREISDVCGRVHLRRRLPRAIFDEYMAALTARATQLPDPDSVESSTRDRNDDYLIALARDSGADFIVSGDRDLLEWADQHPPVISPAEFERLLATETH